MSNNCNHPTCEGDECRRPAKPLNRQSKPRPMSTKRGKELQEYSRERKSFLDANPQCKAQVFPICTYKAEQVHHMAGRENGLLLEKSLWLPICPACHEYVTTHSKEAIEMGLSVSRHKKAS